MQKLILVHYASLDGCMNEKKIEKSGKKKEKKEKKKRWSALNYKK